MTAKLFLSYKWDPLSPIHDNHSLPSLHVIGSMSFDTDVNGTYRFDSNKKIRKNSVHEKVGSLIVVDRGIRIIRWTWNFVLM